MKRKSTLPLSIAALLLVMAAVTFSSCTNNSPDGNIKTLQAELAKYKAQDSMTQLRLAIFDTLDFEFYSTQNWDKFVNSHDKNIKVYYPDGSITTGLYPDHINQLTPMFVFAPDTKITKHPIKFGNGDWTCVVGEMEGTFSEPMPIGDGLTIPPTNKKFKLSMTTIGHWKDGKMIEEYLFWDNQAFMKQIGLAK